MKKYDIANIKLAAEGKKKIEWAAREMKVLESIEKDFLKSKPFKNIKLSACLHVTTETARLAQVLKAGGAEVFLCASNPLSTKDDVAASLVKNDNIAVFAKHGEDKTTYYKHLKAVLNVRPHITMDDGADLATLLHTKYKNQIQDMIGSTEETTTGVIRLRALAEEGKLLLPVVAANDAKTKHYFDNHYGTGQSTFDGILRATNILLAGKTVVIAGYGWCGKGVAKRAQGLGARVIVTEVEPITALQAIMDGFELKPIKEAAKEADIIITVTGNADVVSKDVFSNLKDQCLVANAGHFDVEIDVLGLKKISKKTWQSRPNVKGFLLQNGRTVYLLADGRLVNLAAAEGHPSAVMDMSFAGQALAAKYLIENSGKLEKNVYVIPDKIDKKIASLKISSMGMKHDKLTPRQKKYLNSWQEGT